MLYTVKQEKNLGNRIDARLVNNKKRLYKMNIKTKLYVA